MVLATGGDVVMLPGTHENVGCRSRGGDGESGKAPGIRSDGVVGCRERGFIGRSAGDWRREDGVGGSGSGRAGESGSGAGGGMSVPAVREMLSGGRDGSWNFSFHSSEVENELVSLMAMVVDVDGASVS